jgi:hypothetical protein
MTEATRSPIATAAWLLAGLFAGGLVAGGVALGVADMVRGDAPRGVGAAPAYVDESDSSGIEQIYNGEFQYFVGGGVAVFDCNGDVYPDLYVAGGAEAASLYVNESEAGSELRFSQRPSKATDIGAVTGAYPIDIDSDGHLDLAVLRVGENVMLRGRGGCEFERANEAWGIDGGDDWTVGFSATWEGDQSLPTLAFGNYLALDSLDDRDECKSHRLLRPDGTSYGEPLELAPGWCTLSILFSDWNVNGQRDLRVTNDRHYYIEGQEQLWRIAEDEPPRLYTEDDGWQTMQIWGMGIASHDLTGDGLPEVFLTSQGDNKLQTLASTANQPTYEDIALAVGATAHRPFIGSDTNRPSTAWHAEFGDVNNDGFPDLFVTKGNVEGQTEFAMDDPNNLLLGQEDGSFEEAAGVAGILDYSLSRGGAVTDLNLDGLLDLVVVERREPVKLWRNIGADSGNWLAVDLVQDAPNVNAIGSWVEVRLGSSTLRSEVTVGGGHAGGENGPIHFGLGNADRAEVRVIWPDGDEGPWLTVDANQAVILDRANSSVAPLPTVRD